MSSVSSSHLYISDYTPSEFHSIESVVESGLGELFLLMPPGAMSLKIHVFF